MEVSKVSAEIEWKPVDRIEDLRQELIHQGERERLLTWPHLILASLGVLALMYTLYIVFDYLETVVGLFSRVLP